mgnify:CR=1 FL=1
MRSIPIIYDNEVSKEEKNKLKNWKKVVLPSSRDAIPNSLRNLIRKGIPSIYRKSAWMTITNGYNQMKEKPKLYQLAFQKNFGNYHNRIKSEVCKLGNFFTKFRN